MDPLEFLDFSPLYGYNPVKPTNPSISLEWRSCRFPVRSFSLHLVRSLCADGWPCSPGSVRTRTRTAAWKASWAGGTRGAWRTSTSSRRMRSSSHVGVVLWG